MLSRRDFLESAVQVSALTLGPWASLPGARARGLFCVLFDARSPAGSTFGAELAACGLPGAPIRGDVTEVWYSQLSPRWRQGALPLGVAGLTDYATLFCLERLGWDHGLRLIYRGEHRRSDDQLEHRVATHLGPQAELAHTLSGAQWPLALARRVAALDASDAGRARAVSRRTPESVHRSRGASAELEGLPLYSWVLAPSMESRTA
jgi:hypothetical protein